jgi:hypothetical protein
MENLTPWRGDADADTHDVANLLQLIYVSEAAPGVGPEDVRAILESSQRNNPPAGITGLLCFCGDRFFQVLEGPAEAIHRLLGRLREDRRHRNLFVVHESPIARREFGAWSMRVSILTEDGLNRPVDASDDTGNGAPAADGSGEFPAAGTVSAHALANFLRCQAARLSPG